MGWFCVPQSIGLVREHKEGQKNRAVGDKIAREMGEERASTSTTINRALSEQNVYYGYSYGEDCWNDLKTEADEYRSEYTDKRGRQCSRRLPKQAIIGIAVIVNPPNEVTRDWSVEQHDKFQRDAQAVLSEIEPRLFGRKHERMRADHFDEGLHSHYIYECIGQGSLYDANLRQRMAKEFAQKMRGRGYDIDDPELTDWSRYETDSEYRAAIDQKRKHQGKAQPEYAQRKQIEDDIEFAERKRAALDYDIEGLKRQRDEFSAERNAIMDDIEPTRKRKEKLAKEVADLQQTRQALAVEVDDMQQGVSAYRRMMDEADDFEGWLTSSDAGKYLPTQAKIQTPVILKAVKAYRDFMEGIAPLVETVARTVDNIRGARTARAEQNAGTVRQQDNTHTLDF